MKDLSHYNKDIEIINDFGEWRSKVIDYCEVDCISLYQIIMKFRELIFDHFNLDILDFLLIAQSQWIFTIFSTKSLRVFQHKVSFDDASQFLNVVLLN